MFAKLMCGVLVSGALLGSVTALAVPADAFKCKLEVRDGGGALLSATNQLFQVARVSLPQAQAPGFRETASRAELEVILADSARATFRMQYSHATDGGVAYQDVCVSYSFCMPGSNQICTESACASVNTPTDPNDPNAPSRPYPGWKRVGLIDGIPSLDINGTLSRAEIKNNRKTYRTEFECQHLGTYP